jgi:GH25 family lysozyme M1 (1,4-beta-N-acetylmuramidase)
MSTPVWSIVVGAQPTVIDLSHNNSGFETLADFQALKQAGVQLVIHKAGQMGMAQNTDPLYATRKPLALAAGLKWDAYWFCTSDLVSEQMSEFLRIVGDASDMRLCLDAEQNNGSTISPADAGTFAQELDAKLGRQVLRYGNSSIDTYEVNGWKNGPLWWAKYGPEPTLELMESLGVDPSHMILWQETGSGRVAGNSVVDLSYSRTDAGGWPYPQMPSFAPAPQAPAGPVVPPEGAAVAYALFTPDMEHGSKGITVQVIQALLEAEVDGDWGDATEALAGTFRAANGLPAGCPLRLQLVQGS